MPNLEHCNCEQCQHDRELLNNLRDVLPLLMAVLRAQAMAATTVSNKWKELEGETEFRKMIEKKKSEALIIATLSKSVV